MSDKQTKKKADKPDRKHLRGFASLSPERRREIARAGGKTAQKLGKAHVWTKAEAREAGKKGGQASVKSGKAHRWNSQQAKAAAKKGNAKRKANRKKAREKAA